MSEVDCTDKEAIAYVLGKACLNLPKDLYIPPDCLLVMLEVFSGPLDFLLYLIRKKNLDILEVSVSSVTKQYMQYIDIMRNLKLELAAEYLEMAAILTEIKSRMLLPQANLEEPEEDPRAALVRRLQEYEQIKLAALRLNELPRNERDFFIAAVNKENLVTQQKEYFANLDDIVQAFKEVLLKVDLTTIHTIEREPLSIRERMAIILDTLNEDIFLHFNKFFYKIEGRSGLIVTFLAILELLKEGLIEIVQSEPFKPIYLRKVMPC